ncbi:MAG: mechanosensitive ion channel [Rubritalea sp.]|jgi:small-conductance mechanosensitive channel|tara:strand:+ start:5148 stop:6425 length:1278 start_codon:yes stop_codon:yes gene_type:complete
MPNIEEIKNTLWSLIDGPEDWWQWGIIVGSMLLAIITRFTVHKIFEKTETKFEQILIRQVRARKGIRSIPVFFCLYLWLFQSMLSTEGANCAYIYTIAVLVSAYCTYKLAVSFSKGRIMPKFIGLGILTLFILQQIGWLEPLKSVLTSIHFDVGNIRIDIFKIASAVAALFILMWLVGIITKLLDDIVHTRKEIPPSIRVLIGKTTRLLLYISAFLITLKIAGFPLGALAVFSGALGLGLGFGLQKVISNLVSGVIILLDKSIKPGDVIEINGTYGWINTLRTRYVSVLTRDRKEILIPNEDFITNNVVNWSFSDTNVRIRTNVGVSYDTDVEKAIKVCEEASTNIPRVLKNPAPRCLLMGFGDSSIDLQVRFWINDANEGVANVRSQVLLEIWKAFRDNGIAIPFPQREITIKHSSSEDTPGVG